MYKTKTMRSLSVLLVDDDSDYLWLLWDAMKMTGISCRFRETQRAHDALTILRKSKEELPDVILLDIEMPGMNGIEFLEEVKKEPSLRDITTIIVSGIKMQEEDCDELLQKGAAGVIHKTPDIFEMTQKLREVIDNAA